VSECYFQSIVDRLRIDGNDMDEFASAVNDLDADGRRFLVASSLECQGASGSEAQCIVDTMTDAFGEEFFERERFVLTPAQRSEIERISTDCSGA
jgi:hypothetical protein